MRVALAGGNVSSATARLITGWFRRVRLSAALEVPGDVALDIGTSGGRIDVRGPRTAVTIARTSGGSVEIDDLPGVRFDDDARHGHTQYAGAMNDGGGGRFRAHTSGGGIRVHGVDAPQPIAH
ncbi:MAG TPA: hypothetical protein VHD57_17255 [Vicinamibacterales bacterium]|nr:hypothetical protein [Vicinamibacterales bacterium]